MAPPNQKRMAGTQIRVPGDLSAAKSLMISHFFIFLRIIAHWAWEVLVSGLG